MLSGECGLRQNDETPKRGSRYFPRGAARAVPPNKGRFQSRSPARASNRFKRLTKML